jgi:hypothetical protein
MGGEASERPDFGRTTDVVSLAAISIGMGTSILKAPAMRKPNIFLLRRRTGSWGAREALMERQSARHNLLDFEEAWD